MTLSNEQMRVWKWSGLGWCPAERIRQLVKIGCPEMLRGTKETIGGKKYVPVVLF